MAAGTGLILMPGVPPSDWTRRRQATTAFVSSAVRNCKLSATASAIGAVADRRPVA
jgi:hypothetical protein